MNRPVALLAAAVLLLGFAAGPAMANPITISHTVFDSMDVNTQNFAPGMGNLLTASLLNAGKYDTNLSRIYLKFHLQVLPNNPPYFPPGAQNTTATLRLYYYDHFGVYDPPTPVDLHVYGITANPMSGPGDWWTEGSLPNSTDKNWLEWNAKPIPLGAQVPLGTIPKLTFDNLALSEGYVSCSLATDWILSEYYPPGDKILTLLLAVDESLTAPNGRTYFTSNYYQGTDLVPALILTYETTLYSTVVPLPGSLLLLGTGLLGLGCLRMFRKR